VVIHKNEYFALKIGWALTVVFFWIIGIIFLTNFKKLSLHGMSYFEITFSSIICIGIGQIIYFKSPKICTMPENCRVYFGDDYVKFFWRVSYRKALKSFFENLREKEPEEEN
jgi:hypothetical protein